jgi:hypothetical protein
MFIDIKTLSQQFGEGTYSIPSLYRMVHSDDFKNNVAIYRRTFRSKILFSKEDAMNYLKKNNHELVFNFSAKTKR